MTIEKEVVITLTPQAQQNLENMQRRVWEVENQYGIMHPAAVEMKNTFIHALMQIARFGGMIFAENDLSLLVSSYIQLGIIWHPVKHKQEDGSYERDPLLGEWSVHS